MTTLSMFPDRPLLRLTCQQCGGQMIRYVAYGLLISDGTAKIDDNFTQDCDKCGHSHQAGTVLRFRIGADCQEDVIR